MADSANKSWLDSLPNEFFKEAHGGQNVVATIGNDNRNVIVGHSNSQVLMEAVGNSTQHDSESVNQSLQIFRMAIESKLTTLDLKTKTLAEDRLSQLADELTNNKESPSGDIIIRAGSWLVEHIPGIAGALTELFLPNAVGRVVVKAGDNLVKWIKNLAKT